MKIRKPFYRISLKKKLFYGFSLTFGLIFAVFGILILQTNGSRYQQQSYEYCSRIVGSNISLIDNYFNQLSSVARSIASDRDVISAVSYREKTSNIDYSVELFNQRRVADKLHRFDVLEGVQNTLIVGSGGEYLYYSDLSPRRNYSFREQDWFPASFSSAGPAFFNYHPTDYLLNPASAETVSLAMPIYPSTYYSTAAPACLLCDFSLDPILGQSSDPNETQIAIYSGSEIVSFPSGISMSPAQKDLLHRNLAQKEHAFLIPAQGSGDRDYLVSAEQSKISGWSILGILPLDSLQALTRTNTIFVLTLITVSIAVILILSDLITRSLLDPMNRLLQKFDAIGRGDPNITFEETESIEIDQIAQTAMDIIQKNQELTRRNAEADRRQAQSSLRALQHQINPHFLNNVLQSMKALAVCHDTESVSKMATLLGKLLSYSVYNPYDMVPLREEFAYIDTYIALQNVRFQNRLIYTADLSEEAAEFRTPKLIIQPLVENACVHGLCISEGGRISVSADIDEDLLCIAVTNSGKQIDSEKLAYLNRLLREGSVEEQDSSIGLLNVRARLKGCYGDGADLEILSRDGMSTSVILTIPVRKE